MLEFKRVGFELPESVTFENETFFYPEKIKFYKFDGYKINVIDKKSNDNQGQRGQSQNNYQPNQHQQDVPEIDLDQEVPF